MNIQKPSENGTEKEWKRTASTTSRPAARRRNQGCELRGYTRGHGHPPSTKKMIVRSSVDRKVAEQQGSISLSDGW